VGATHNSGTSQWVRPKEEEKSAKNKKLEEVEVGKEKTNSARRQKGKLIPATATTNKQRQTTITKSSQGHRGVTGACRTE
jgi:hypothetical protein